MSPENNPNLTNLGARAFCVDQEMDDWRGWASGNDALTADVEQIRAALKRIRAAVAAARLAESEQQENTHV